MTKNEFAGWNRYACGGQGTGLFEPASWLEHALEFAGTLAVTPLADVTKLAKNRKFRAIARAAPARNPAHPLTPPRGGHISGLEPGLAAVTRIAKDAILAPALEGTGLRPFKQKFVCWQASIMITNFWSQPSKLGWNSSLVMRLAKNQQDARQDVL